MTEEIPSKKTFKARPFRGRTGLRLLILFLVVLAPLAALDLHLFLGARQTAVRDYEAELERLARVIAAEHVSLFRSARDVLLALAQIEEVRGPDHQACSEVMARVAGQYDRYTVFSKVDPAGYIVCSSTPLGEPRNVSSFVNIRNAFTKKEFSLSDFAVGPVSGKPVLVFSLPMLDPAGEVIGLVNTGLNLDWLAVFLSELNLPAKTTVRVMGGRGRLWAAYPPSGGRVGSSLAGTDLYRLISSRSGGRGETRDPEDRELLVGFAEVPGVPEGLFVVVSRERAEALAPLRRNFNIRLAVYGTVFLFSLALAWLASHFIILRWVAGLSEQAAGLASGDYSLRNRLPDSGTELGALARSFNQMAEELEARQAELRRSQETALALLNANRDSAFLLDLEGRVLAANQAGAVLAGLKPDLTEKNILEILPQVFGGKGREVLATVARDSRPLQFVDEFEGRFFDNYLYPIREKEGRAGRLAFFCRDVTTKMASEKALRLSEKNLAKSQEMARMGNLVWDIGTNSVHYSTAFFRLLGVNPEYLVETYESFLALIDPADLPRVRKALADAVFEEKAFDLEHQVLSPGREPMIVHSQGEIEYDENDEPARIHITVQDVTESRGAEKRLREGRARLKAVVDTAVDGIITIDENGLIESFNLAAEKIFGYLSSEVVGRNVNMLMSSPYREEHDQYLRNYLLTGRRKIMGRGREVSGKKRDGTPVPLDLAVSEVLLEDRRIFTGILRDITDRKKAEAGLEQSRSSLAEAQRLARLGNWEWDVARGLVTWSEEVYRIFEVEPGREVDFESYLGRVHPADRERLEQTIRETMAEGETFSVEHRLLFPDGREKHVAGQGEVVRGAEGGPLKLFGTVQDITDRKKAELELRIRDSAIQSSINGIFLTDPSGYVTYANRSAAEMWRLEDPKLFLARPVRDFFQDRSLTTEIMDELNETGTWFGELEAWRAGGEVFPVQLSATLVLDEVQAPVCLMFSMVDVTERKRAEEQLRLQAIHDSLSGLFNRRHFFELLEKELNSARRHGFPLTVCLADLDHFKAVNDTHGHRIGDEVLAAFGRLLSQELRTEDTVGRYGGEEFALALPHTSARDAFTLLERIRTLWENVAFEGEPGKIFHVTASFGLASFDSPDYTESELLDMADKALYQAKEAGRNRAVIYDGPGPTRRTPGESDG